MIGRLGESPSAIRFFMRIWIYWIIGITSLYLYDNPYFPKNQDGMFHNILRPKSCKREIWSVGFRF